MFTSFGETLKLLRKHKQMSQQQLAKSVGVHSNTISGWERGNNLPDSKGIVLELAHHLHLDEQETRQLLEASLTALAPYWQVPYQRNPFFTGREEVLHQLHETLKQEHTVVLSQSYTLSGLGGIGKTQTAIEYAYRYANEYSAIFWVSAETRETIFSSYIAIADMLHLPERLQQDQEKVVVAVMRWLTTHYDWFIIFDNVEDPTLVKGVLPATRCGSFLFTSRRQVLGLEAQTLGLEQMPLEEGMCFLLRRARLLDPMALPDSLPPIEKTLAQEIAAAMDGLPLALDQAGAYIEATRCSLSDYRQLFLSSQLLLLDRREAYRDHPLSVTRTFMVAFEQIQRSNTLAADLLTVCAFLAPEAIPEMFFTEGATSLGSTFGVLTVEPLAFQDAIQALLSYSLLQRNSATHTLTIHRLVQVVLKGLLSEAVQHTWVGRVIKTMSLLFPSDELTQADYWQICERLLPHAQLCITLWEQWKEDETLYICFLDHLATYLVMRARYEEAESLFQQALSVAEPVLGPIHSLIASLLHGLADLYREQGKYKEAESLFQRALHIWEQTKGSEHLLVAKSLNKLGVLYWTQGKYREAEPLYQRALCLFEQQLDHEHLQISTPLTNLGILYKDQGKYAEAESLYQRALHIREQHLGSVHPLLAYPLTCLANLYKDQGNYVEAESLYQRALHIREQRLGSEHPQVAYPLNNLADLYMKLGKYAEAEPLYQRAIGIFEQQFGSEHSLVAYPLDGLANLYRELGDYEHAEILYQRAIGIFEQQFGSEHPNTATVAYNLAQLWEKQGKSEEARIGYSRALAVRKLVLGTHHPDTMETYDRFIALLHAMGQHDEAIRLKMLRNHAPKVHHPE